MKYKEFANKLLEKMHKWETASGKRETIQKFAEYLDVSQPLLSIWLKGNTKPTDEKIALLAEKLGDDIYDSLGLNRPNPKHKYILETYDRAPESEQNRILKILSKYENTEIPSSKEKKSAIKS